MADNYGKVTNVPQATFYLDSTSTAIVAAQMLTKEDATAGFVKEVDAANEQVTCVAVSAGASPAADGGTEIQGCIDPNQLFVYPPDAGTVTVALRGTLMDAGADGRSIDINGSTTNDVHCIDVDVARNLVYVRFLKLGQ
jgi:hypothetical protein